MAIEIKVLHCGDEAVLSNVAAGVFDNPIDPKLTAEFLADHRHHIAVAIDDGLVVGFASAVHYIHPDKLPELWINEVAFAPTYRRRGLGKAVLKALFEVGPRTQLHGGVGPCRSKQCRRNGSLSIGGWNRRGRRSRAKQPYGWVLVRPHEHP